MIARGQAMARRLRAAVIKTTQYAYPLVERLGMATPCDENALLTRWWRGAANWGDDLNPVLVEALSGKRVVPSTEKWNARGLPVYSVVGSLLDNAAEPNLVVWGSGFMHQNGRTLIAPRKVCAVRGPLTRANLLRQGIDCPEVYGDPALLYPSLYLPERSKKGLVGLIPHFADRNEPIVRDLVDRHGFRLIDIASGIDEVVRAICNCDWVASSSLHGLIAADAYGVPNVWVKLSPKVLGGGFKFHDYFLGVSRKPIAPLVATKRTTVAEFHDVMHQAPISFDRERLLAACPFLSDNFRMISV